MEQEKSKDLLWEEFRKVWEEFQKIKDKKDPSVCPHCKRPWCVPYSPVYPYHPPYPTYPYIIYTDCTTYKCGGED